MNDAINEGTPGELFYRPNRFDDWGYIRTADGEIFAVVRRPLDEEEADRHRRDKTDPFEPLARALMSALHPEPSAADTLSPATEVRREAIARLRKMADCHIVDPTPVDAYGRFDATYGDIRTLLALLCDEREKQREIDAKIAEGFGRPYAINTNTGAMMFRAITEKIASAIRNGGKQP